MKTNNIKWIFIALNALCSRKIEILQKKIKLTEKLVIGIPIGSDPASFLPAYSYIRTKEGWTSQDKKTL